MMQERVLFVDDDTNVLEAYQRKFQHVLHVRTAAGPLLGIRELQTKGPFAVVIADMNMPSMNGIEFLKKVQEISPQSVRMMLTGNADVKIAMDAVNEGAVFRFLTKPCPTKLMAESLLSGIKQYRLITAEAEVLEGTLEGVTELLIEILSLSNPGAFGDALLLGNMAKRLAAELGIEDAWEVELAATLSRVGVLGLPTELYVRASDSATLTSEEKKALESVPAVGHELLNHVPRLSNVAKIVLYQKKMFDGGGLPVDGVSGIDIPIGSRILKIVTDFQELRALGQTSLDSFRTMKSRDGWYDPVVLSTFGNRYVALPNSEDRERCVMTSLSGLSEGATLASPICTIEGRMLVAAGRIISGTLLVSLRRYAGTNTIKEPIELLASAPRHAEI